MNQDSLYIKDGFVCYSRPDWNDEGLIDDESKEPNLVRIELQRVKQVEMNLRSKTIRIHYTKDHELIAQLESEETLDNFKNDLLLLCPNSRTLNLEKTKFHIIKKPLIAILVLLAVIIIISLVDPQIRTPNSSYKVNGVMALLKAFASLGMTKVLLIFGGIGVLPILRIYFNLRNARKTKIIQVRSDSIS